MGQFISAAILVTFVAGALAFNSRDTISAFTNDTIQVGVVVDDLEASVAFYTDIIGMQKTGGFSVDKNLSKAAGLANGKPFDVEVLKLRDAPSANEWKLMSFKGTDSGKHDKYISDATGMQYITIFVDNLDAHISRIEASEVPTLGDTPITLPDGRRFLLIQDPNGIFIELIGN